MSRRHEVGRHKRNYAIRDHFGDTHVQCGDPLNSAVCTQ